MDVCVHIYIYMVLHGQGYICPYPAVIFEHLRWVSRWSWGIDPLKNQRHQFSKSQKDCLFFDFHHPRMISGVRFCKKESRNELKYIYKKIQSRLVDSCGGPVICNPLPSLPLCSPIGEGSLRLEGWPNPRTTRVTTRSTSGMAVSSTWDREVGWNGGFWFSEGHLGHFGWLRLEARKEKDSCRILQHACFLEFWIWVGRMI